MPENTPWWKAANPGEKPWETARRAKEAKAAPQDTRGVLRRAWDALNRPVIPVERGVRALMPGKEMGPVGENAAGVGIGLGRVAESLSSPAALGSLGAIGLLSRPGVMGDMLMAFLSGDMGWEAIKNFRKTQDADYQGALPREKTADYTATTAHGALAVAPWLHMGAKAARSGKPAASSTKPIPEEFQVNVAPEVRAQVEPNIAQPNLPVPPQPRVQPVAPVGRQRQVSPARAAAEALPIESRRPWWDVENPTLEQARAGSEAVGRARAAETLERNARIRADEATRRAERQAAREAEQAEIDARLNEGIRQWHEDPLVGDAAVRRYREATKGMDEPPPPDTPWREFEDALGAEIIPKATKPPKFRDMRIDSGDHPLKSVIDAILERGGISIKQAKRAGTFEDWRGSLSPAMYRRIMRQKGGFAPDDIAMNLEGHGVRDENHLRDMLSQYRKQEPIRITKDEQMRQYEEAQAEWDRRMREEVPPEWLEAMEIDSAKQGAPRFDAGKMPVDREGFLDYELMGVREPGQEGFARFRDDRGSEMPIGAGASRLAMDEPGEFTLVKVEYDTPGYGISSFYDVVEGFTGKRAIAAARKNHPEATKIELDVEDYSPKLLGRKHVRKHIDNYYDNLDEMGLGRYWRNQKGFADTKPKNGNPLQLFADELLGAQNAQRQEAVGDLFQQILQADPARVSKRELLGLDKKKKKSGSSPLLDLIKPQGSMFEE